MNLGQSGPTGWRIQRKEAEILRELVPDEGTVFEDLGKSTSIWPLAVP